MTAKPEALRLAEEWQAKTDKEAGRRNSAYDHYGMGNTPETVDPLGAKMVAELLRLHAENERLAALAEAQQPAPSAAAAEIEGGPPGSGGWEKHAVEMERQRDYYRQRCHTMEEHQNGGVWYWQGDDGDNLESMGNSMLVVIRADQLRSLMQPSPTPQVDSTQATSDLITVRRPTTRAEVEWLVKLAHLLVGDVNEQLQHVLDSAEAPQADRQPAPVLDSLALMKVVMRADEALAGRCSRGTTNWAAAIGKAVQDAVMAALRPEATTDRKCAQCKKVYKHGPGSVGCPRCAPGVEIAEAEFQKPIASVDLRDPNASVFDTRGTCSALATAAAHATDALQAQQPAPSAAAAVAIKAMGYGGSTGINDYLMSDGTVKAMRPAEVKWAPQADSQPAPIDMVLHCPKCGLQHIDAPEKVNRRLAAIDPPAAWALDPWTNEPHRSHLCHGCGHIWRPADVPTNGVAAVKTTGKADSPIAARASADSQPAPEYAGNGMFKGETIQKAAEHWANWCDVRSIGGVAEFLRFVAKQADSVTAPAGPIKPLPYEPTSTMLIAARERDPALPIETVRAIYWSMWRTAPTPTAQAAPRVLEDAARWQYLRDERDVALCVMFFGNGCTNITIADVIKAIDAKTAARKEGANHD